LLQRRGRPGREGAGVVIARQYVHNACIRCPSLLLPHADAPARLPLCVPSAGGGACTLSSRVRETALARSSSIPSVVRWPWRCWLHAARLPSMTTGPRGPHMRYISPIEHRPLSEAAFRVGSLARAATRFRPAGGKHVLCAMRDSCACIHQRTIAQVSRVFCAILAQNVGIVRKTEITISKKGAHYLQKHCWQECDCMDPRPINENPSPTAPTDA
jgi:hypothetical protein